jgi:hypothetical protein
MKNSFGPEYASLEDTGFVAKYKASCFCGAVHHLTVYSGSTSTAFS